MSLTEVSVLWGKKGCILCHWNNRLVPCNDVIDLTTWSCGYVRFWIRTWPLSDPASIELKVKQWIVWFRYSVNKLPQIQSSSESDPFKSCFLLWFNHIVLCVGAGHWGQPRHPRWVHRGREDDRSVVEAAVSGGHGRSRVPYRNCPARQDEGVHAGAWKLLDLLNKHFWLQWSWNVLM